MLRAQTVLLWRTAHWAVLVVRNCARSTLPALIRGLKTSPSLSKGFIVLRFLRMRGVLAPAVPHEPNVPSGTFARASGLFEHRYAPHSQEQRETSLRKRLLQLSRLASLRHAQRERKGGIDFDQPDARVKLDEAGRPQGVELRRKNAATSLVEEMMIWANEVVAEHLSRAKFPCVYRVHEAPDLEGLRSSFPSSRSSLGSGRSIPWDSSREANMRSSRRFPHRAGAPRVNSSRLLCCDR